MNKLLKTSLLAIFFLVFLSLFQAKSKDIKVLKVYTFNRPPLYIVKGNKFFGILVEKIKKILDKAKINYKFIEMPPARILHQLKIEVNACSIGWLKNKEREKSYIYSKPFFIENNYFIIVMRKNLNPEYKNLFKSPFFTIALVKGFSYGDEIDKLLANSKIKKFRIPNANAKMLLKMVKNNRVDMTIVSREEAEAFLKDSEFENSIKLIPFNERNCIKRYIIFSKKTDRDIIKRINNAIDDLENKE
ncbi:polar amino acid transport system substrate-binding protein [Thermotomaculum hydrothermale]|uniref:Polar amino acid transport system substrate-binding protein n=1 Tax=Thermotomaculum hydrothermale TaxID=981385 RepID=A0A7R6PQ56_9BACT|nr:transporter substrate-binding domain-containing protein [Thermotomaculum hydrothermale]BBB33276.1 polar amino acid transport system substrate-binding protein [Thermotomaculum hydrothermale]